MPHEPLDREPLLLRARAAPYVLLGLNAGSVAAAVAWVAFNWTQYARGRGSWSLWPVVWLVGTGLMVLAQVVFSVLPTCLLVRHRGAHLAAGLRRALVASALAAPLVNLGGVVAVMAYDRLVPARGAPG